MKTDNIIHSVLLTALLLSGSAATSQAQHTKVLGSVYGGGNVGSVGTFTVNAAGKPATCAENTGKCTVVVSGTAEIGPDGMLMTREGGPDDHGHVFGAGKGLMADPSVRTDVEHIAYVDNTDVTVSGNAFVKGSVYGGSESGHVLHNTVVKIEGGQIGCGQNTTSPFDSDIWADSYTPSDGTSLDCASWPFASPFAPYDPFANAEGDLDKYPAVEGQEAKPTDGGRRSASDGHTYYGNVFGGGSGSIPYFDTVAGNSKYLSTAGTVEGNTSVTISGGHILTNVYGGCESTNVLGTATISMTGGTVGVPRTVAQIAAHPLTGYIFGAGKGDQRIYFNKETNVNDAVVSVTGGRVYGSVFGGGEDGHVLRNVTVTIGTEGSTDGPVIGTTGTSFFDGNVFGGGRGFGGEALTAGNVGGSVELDIKSGRILGSVYGGGRLASVGYGLYLVDEEITVGGETVKPYGILRPDNEYDGSYPNPSTEEASAYYNKGRGYITVNISGGTIGNDLEYVYPTDAQKAAMPYTTFDYRNHLLYTKGGNVFAGGMGRLYGLDGTTLLPLWPKLGKCKQTVLNMTGGTVKSNVYGGAELGVVGQNATVNITGGTVGTKIENRTTTTNDLGEEETVVTDSYYYGSVFGGGKGSTASITYPAGTLEADQTPISAAGTTEGNVLVKLNEGIADDAQGAVVHQVFGCNDMNGTPKGTVTVHVYATQTGGAEDISTKPLKSTGDYDVEAVYGGGNMAAYEPSDLATGTARVIIDGCGLTSIRQVYGGGNAASTPATNVEVNGTYEIFELFGGGNGADRLPSGDANPGANVGYKDYHLVENNAAFATKGARVSGADFAAYRYGTGEATVNIKGGTIHRVFGGSNTKGNVRKTALTMLEEFLDNGTPVCAFNVDEAYGGGKSAPMDAEAILHMACIPGLKAAYGGAEAADIQDNVTLTITNGTFNRVFGGNNQSGTIRGSITVDIEEVGCRPIIIGELYGGGNLAGYSVRGYKQVTADGKQQWVPRQPSDALESGMTTEFANPLVNVKSFTSIGNVYGGGYGSSAVMVGSPTVNINVGVGGQSTHSEAVVPPGRTLDDVYPIPSHASGAIGAINNVYGGGNAAAIVGNTFVNIGNEQYVPIKTVIVGTTDVSNYYTRSAAAPYTYTKCADGATAADGVTYYLRVSGADIRGNVFGGGNNAEVSGDTNVVIGRQEE